ncbi:M48 family metallopeptidase, partial [bacterium]|nr:M48 family metallopeptidase [candidate division CSSED10-310 bacterium]
KNKVPSYLEDQLTKDVINRSIEYEADSQQYSIIKRTIMISLDWGLIFLGYNIIDQFIRIHLSNHYIRGLVFFGLLGLISLIFQLPFSVYHDFFLEKKYGFNKKTWKIFILDLFKTIIIGIIIGGILLVLILFIMKNTGSFWWIFAFVSIAFFQLVFLWIYPLLIAPLFNKFTPLKDNLAESIENLARRIGFKTSGIYTMDGSKRSEHSDAYFTGIGKAKRIVFFDTLIQKLEPQEILAVLGHEMGHFKLGHVRKILLLTMTSLFLFFVFLAYLKEIPVFYPSFGFAYQSDYAAIIIFSLLFSELMFPFQYIVSRLSRHHEFAADRFAVQALSDSKALETSLIKLHKDNLSCPWVHPYYAAFYYSHPALEERLNSIRKNRQDRSDAGSNLPDSNSSQKCHNPGSIAT